MKALMAVPKKEVDAKSGEVRRKRAKRTDRLRQAHK